ncbi:chord-domain-containing protein [Melanogaster broomeanus]|nr:chord-domain-containing protein [Melanogaster broomeanus]
MLRCTRKGCGREFSSTENTDASCSYHPGAPVFHEGLKSWSCCSDINKPVLDFDEFIKMPRLINRGKRDLLHNAFRDSTSADTCAPAPVVTTQPEDEDDLSVTVAAGTPCSRKGCGVAFVSDEENRIGDGEGVVCSYHPAPPIFHEGSKGYLCCKRRVLEFEEFLKIEGCKKGRHVFVPKQNHQAEQFTECRVDHYQTPNEVHVSVFAKQADKERSKVTIEKTQVHLDLYLPAQKRFKKTIQLFGLIYGTKVEVVLKKLDIRSWTVLERTTHDLGNLKLARIGGKDIILDEQNRSRAL